MFNSDEALDDFVESLLETTTEAYYKEHEGYLMGWVLKVARDPMQRKHQRMFMLQAIERALGPHEEDLTVAARHDETRILQ